MKGGGQVVKVVRNGVVLLACLCAFVITMFCMHPASQCWTVGVEVSASGGRGFLEDGVGSGVDGLKSDGASGSVSREPVVGAVWEDRSKAASEIRWDLEDGEREYDSKYSSHSKMFYGNCVDSFPKNGFTFEHFSAVVNRICESKENYMNRSHECHEELKQDEMKNWGRIYTPNRIVCLVPTVFKTKQALMTRIDQTWGKLCTKLYFFVKNNSDDNIHEVLRFGESLSHGKIIRVETRFLENAQNKNLWEKCRKMWIRIAKDFINEGEWFVKVDDDTFLLVQHLQRFLMYYNPAVPHYLGHVLLHDFKSRNIVFNAGAAYVLSREAVLRVAPVLDSVVEVSTLSFGICASRPGMREDAELSVCLRSIGINPENTLDHLGRQRFLPFMLSGHLKLNRTGNEKDWFWRSKPMIDQGGSHCCVEEYISSHPYKNHLGKEQTLFMELYNSTLLQYQKVCTTKPEIPPKPTLFLYNEEEFKESPLDYWRNIPDPPKDQPVFKGL